jgi:amino acid transporter
VTMTASLVVPTDRLAGSDAPLLEVVREGSGLPTRLFSAIALLAVANGALINMIMASRLLYGMANERIVPRPFPRVHESRRTPWVAIIFTTLLAMLLISIGKLDELAIVTVMLLLLVFAGVNVAVLVLRRDRVEHRHFVAPRVFPLLGLAISLVLFVKRIADGDATVFAILGVILVIGAALWLVNRYVFGGAERFDPAKLDV